MKSLEQIREEVIAEINQDVCDHKSLIKAVKKIWDREKKDFVETGEYGFSCASCNAEFIQVPFVGFDQSDADLADTLSQ